MFVNESSGKPLRCPYCGELLDPPCEHLILDFDRENCDVCGPWAENFTEWQEQLKKAVVGYARSGKRAPALLRDDVKHVRGQYKDATVPDDHDDVDTDDSEATLVESLILSVTGVSSEVGVINNGPWNSSSGTFLFAQYPEKALLQIQKEIASLCL